MKEEFEVITSKREIDQLMQTYFAVTNSKLIKALKLFANKEGYGREIIFIFFQCDFDDYDMAQLPEPLDNQHVIIELGYPAVEKEQIAYLDFKTFYNYLDEYIKKEVQKSPEKSNLLELLKEVKHSLDV